MRKKARNKLIQMQIYASMDEIQASRKKKKKNRKINIICIHTYLPWFFSPLTMIITVKNLFHAFF